MNGTLVDGVCIYDTLGDNCLTENCCETTPLVAMYAPHFVLVLVFGGRLASNIRRMLRGEAGPWNEYDKTAAASAKLSDSMSAQDGVAAIHSGEI